MEVQVRLTNGRKDLGFPMLEEYSRVPGTGEFVRLPNGKRPARVLVVENISAGLRTKSEPFVAIIYVEELERGQTVFDVIRNQDRVSQVT